ncbi:hypothetical protein [Methylobacterium sp. WL9]|nr:hypothetical protein [Methylobacterium sp. WL9]
MIFNALAHMASLRIIGFHGIVVNEIDNEKAGDASSRKSVQEPIWSS